MAGRAVARATTARSTASAPRSYRDGRDSVAWHGDRIPLELVEPVVALVSLGSPRALRMRCASHKADARAFRLLPGDLFVMGGTSQRTWEHSVPKVARGGPAAQPAVPSLAVDRGISSVARSITTDRRARRRRDRVRHRDRRSCSSPAVADAPRRGVVTMPTPVALRYASFVVHRCKNARGARRRRQGVPRVHRRAAPACARRAASRSRRARTTSTSTPIGTAPAVNATNATEPEWLRLNDIRRASRARDARDEGRHTGCTGARSPRSGAIPSCSPRIDREARAARPGLVGGPKRSTVASTERHAQAHSRRIDDRSHRGEPADVTEPTYRSVASDRDAM